MMAFGGSTIMAVLVLSGLLHSVAAIQYTVGANIGGWTLQADNSDLYDPEFKNTKFVPGDVLLFPFVTGQHNVYEVSAADLTNCNYANPIAKYTATNSTVTLATAGTHSYICAIPTHCQSYGMHLQVTVSAASSPTLAPAPSTKAPAPSTKAPAPAPKAASPTPKTPTTPGGKAPAPAPAGPGSNTGASLLSAPAMIVGSVLAGCALLLL